MVPNLQPSVRPLHKIALIGEAPGRDEESQGKPFIGFSGTYLKGRLAKANINFDQCFVGNVSQCKPPNNEIGYFQWSGPEIQSGLNILKDEINEFRPNLIVLMGNVALKAALDPQTNHPLKPGKFQNSVMYWRGSVFQCTHLASPFAGFKCIATVHPSAVQRQFELAPLFQFDLMRAYRESFYPEVRPPLRDIDTTIDPVHTIQRLREVKAARRPIAIDIEGGIGTFCCISIATSASNVFIVPISNRMSNLYVSEDDEARIWLALADVLCDPGIPKILQNSLYDRFVLQYSYQLPILGVNEDIMLKHWELYCELPKALYVQTSIYTEECYYKDDRQSENYQKFLEYCCKDSAVTYEIAEKTDPQLHSGQWSVDHYRFNVELLNPLLYMELKGIKYDYAEAQRRRDEIMQKYYGLQFQLDALAGLGTHGKASAELLIQTIEENCKKRRTIITQWSDLTGNWLKKKKRGVEDWFNVNNARIVELGNRYDSLTDAEKGELSCLLYLHLNVDSPDQLNEYLYVKLKLPLQTNEEGQPTSDENALLKLRIHCHKTKNELGLNVTDLCIQMRRLGTRAGMLQISADMDGRIRCGYNIVGTETGRITCYTSPTGSGYNLQTIPQEDRDLFKSDEGHWFFQCDLAGADGWTIGAHCDALGDPTMLDDLRAKIKPAKVLCLGLRGNVRALNPRIERAELASLCDQVKKEDWDYFACKVGIWGTCYLMGPDTLRDNLLEDSDGKLIWSRREAQEFQRLVYIRYQVKRWQDATARKLSVNPSLTAASGHRRVFFGRSTEVLGKALAHEPQANTTYATNLAMRRLWFDPENRVSNEGNPEGGPRHHPGTLRIEPLHQVHDAICGQFKKSDTTWAAPRIESYFDNTLLIANRQIKIPFEGAYGPSWGQQGPKHGGGNI